MLAHPSTLEVLTAVSDARKKSFDLLATWKSGTRAQFRRLQCSSGTGEGTRLF
jgi:hypothetical protein